MSDNTSLDPSTVERGTRTKKTRMKYTNLVTLTRTKKTRMKIHKLGNLNRDEENKDEYTQTW